MPRNLRPILQLDFSGGINTIASPYLVGERQVLAADNLVLDEHGSLRPRDGLVLLYTAAAARPIRAHAAFNPTNAATVPLIIQRGPAGPNQVIRIDTDAVVGTMGQDEALPDMLQAVNQMIFINGYEVPWTWNGTTFAQLTAQPGQTVPPGAKHAAFHLGALWVWNTAASSTALDGPSSLRSTLGSALNDWPNANQVFVGRDDGQVGMGMTTFTIVETGISPTATLVLFKDYSAYQVIGAFGSPNFALQRIKSDMGCIAPRTIQFVSGHGAIRLTHKGFALYNGVEDRLISEEVRPAIFGGSTSKLSFVALDFDAVRTGSWAVQAQDPPLYLAVCPVVGGGQRVFCYDLTRRAWTLLTLPSGVVAQSMSLYTTPGQNPEPRVGTSDGRVFRWWTGAEKDHPSADVEFRLLTRPYVGHSPFEPSYFRRARVLVEGQPGHAVTVRPLIDDIPGPAEMTARSEAFRSLSEQIIDLPIHRTARHVALEITGRGAVRIRGVEFHASPKPIRTSPKEF